MTSGNTAQGVAVWDRVWRHDPSTDKDRALIHREENSTRWALIGDALMRTFGRIEGLRTIELGSGRGDLSFLLASRGASVTLLDFSPTVLDLARKRFERFGVSADYVQADLFDTAMLETQYDVSLSSGVIEHFRGCDRLRSMHAHRAVLRPGGLAVISVPNAACVPYRLWKAYLELRGWWPYGAEVPYSKRELARLARLAGFARRRVSCTSFLRSVGDHFCGTFLHRRPRWADRASVFDGTMGFTLTLFAWTATAPADQRQ